MPSLIVNFKVVSNGGTINNGDSLIISPTSTTKSFFGSGSSLIGDFSSTFTLFSATLTNDPSGIDASTIKTATGT